MMIACYGNNGVLRNQSAFILQLHFQIISSQDGCRPVNNLHKFACWKPMIHVISHPGLKTKVRDFPDCCTAIQEGLVHAAHLRDMSMQGHQSPIGQDKLDVVFGMFREELLEFRSFHSWVGSWENFGNQQAQRSLVSCVLEIRSMQRKNSAKQGQAI